MADIGLIEKRIVKRGSKHCVVSEDGKKNLGCGPSEEWAKKRLGQVEYFKHAHKSLTEDGIAAGLDDGSLQVSVAELKSFVAKHFPTAACPKCGSTVEDPHIGRGTHKCSKCGHEYQPHSAEQKDSEKKSAVELARGNYLVQKSIFKSLLETKKGFDANKMLPKNRRFFYEQELREIGKSDGSSEAIAAIQKKYDEIGRKKRARFDSDTELDGEQKHLPGQHDQSSHAGVKGAAGKVAHTSAQLRDAAARQYAKDTGMSIKDARTKVGSGAKVPTTKVTQNVDDLRKLITDKEEIVNSRLGGFGRPVSQSEKEEYDDEIKDLKTSLSNLMSSRKSLVLKADQNCLKKIWSEYYKYYSGKWIAQGWNAYRAGKYSQAADAFEKARDGFQPNKNPSEYDCLEAWRADAEEKAGGEQKHLPGKHDQSTHGHGGGGNTKRKGHANFSYEDEKSNGWLGDTESARDAAQTLRSLGIRAKVVPSQYTNLSGVAVHKEDWSDAVSHGKSYPHIAPFTKVMKSLVSIRSADALQLFPNLLPTIKSQLRGHLDEWVQLDSLVEKAKDKGLDTADPGLFTRCLDTKGAQESDDPNAYCAAVHHKITGRWPAEDKEGKSQALIPISFMNPGLFQTEWRITKARIKDNGLMEWEATTSKFDRDIEGDKVTKAFYEEAIRRFKSKAVPPPFVSVAHYSSFDDCENCGHIFKSLTDYICPQCQSERLSGGVATEIWIDGRQPKARGIFFPTELGRQLYKEVKSDIQNKLPMEERIRISMGFYPDPDGTIHKSKGQRDFLKGWIEHFAFTRVPVVAETLVSVS